MNDEVSDDRRRFERLPFESDVMLVKNEEREQLELQDISLKGFLVSSPEKLDLVKNDEVRALIQLGNVGEDDPVIDLLAEVKHVGDEGVGAKWREIDGESFTHLSRLLKFNFDEPDRLLKEFDALVEED